PRVSGRGEAIEFRGVPRSTSELVCVRSLPSNVGNLLRQCAGGGARQEEARPAAPLQARTRSADRAGSRRWPRRLFVARIGGRVREAPVPEKTLEYVELVQDATT